MSDFEAPKRNFQPAVVELRAVEKVYFLGEGNRLREADDASGAGKVLALRGITLRVMPGEYVSIMGQSGSGKSTLLHIIGCLHRPTAGTYLLDGTDVGSVSDAVLSSLRNKKIGFVFQKFNLLPQENIVENTALPLVYAKVPRKERLKAAAKVLSAVGLSDRKAHRPTQLSGGQSQRAAVARALVTNPSLLLADEPTGNLDSRTGLEIMGLFQALHRLGCTIIQVTHDREMAEFSQRIVRLRDGIIEQEEQISEPRQAPCESLSPDALFFTKNTETA
jgi:putative ABC transport system ATP-binding protein